MIVTRDLSRQFNRGRVKALREVSITVNPGQIFGLLGPNGAGKTTFIKILLGILHASSGQATLFDYPVSSPSAREKVGYLPENHRFPEFLTGAAVLDFSARLSGMQNKQDRTDRAEKLLKCVNMWEWRSTKIKKYSKGMLQRLGLAQSMLHDPELIFLDEPTDGVDPIGRKEIRDLLLELKAQGKTIFLNSHLLSEVEMICDEVAILHKGKLLRQSTVRELTTSDQRFQIHADIKNEHLLERIRQSSNALQTANGFLEVVVSNVVQLNSIIDMLRSEQILIQSIQPYRQSLEDSFVQTIQGAGAADFNELLSNQTATASEAHNG
ncbi:MAG: ABC transporter ATP-binding protein [Deferribacteres bacterium]|nr:ABC transporter ATP-binding protein [candidate division KSB1 bacterium]MCB9512550.1 ABC transporter ATP-binding protein [Deferribacteres bacterium]